MAFSPRADSGDRRATVVLEVRPPTGPPPALVVAKEPPMMRPPPGPPPRRFETQVPPVMRPPTGAHPGFLVTGPPPNPPPRVDERGFLRERQFTGGSIADALAKNAAVVRTLEALSGDEAIEAARRGNATGVAGAGASAAVRAAATCANAGIMAETVGLQTPAQKSAMEDVSVLEENWRNRINSQASLTPVDKDDVMDKAHRLQLTLGTGAEGSEVQPPTDPAPTPVASGWTTCVNVKPTEEEIIDLILVVGIDKAKSKLKEHRLPTFAWDDAVRQLRVASGDMHEPDVYKTLQGDDDLELGKDLELGFNRLPRLPVARDCSPRRQSRPAYEKVIYGCFAMFPRR